MPDPVGSENSSDTCGLRAASSAFFGYPSPVVMSIAPSPALVVGVTGQVIGWPVRSTVVYSV